MALQYIVSPADFDSVRNVVEVGLSAEELPDATIADPALAGAAELEVSTRLTGILLTPEQEESAKLAAIYLTAANILEAFPQVTSERHNDEHQYAVTRLSAQQRVASLRARATTILTPLLITPTKSAITHFAVAPATRVRGFRR